MKSNSTIFLIFTFICLVCFSQENEIQASDIDTTLCLQLYPLKVGNEWIYIHESTSYTVFGTEYYIDTVYKEIIGDTLMMNDKKYFIIKEKTKKYIQSSYYYERKDSSSGKIYSYDTSHNQEYLLDNLFAEIGDTIESFGYSSSLYTTFVEEGKIFAFGDSLYYKKFHCDDLDQHEYLLLQNFGIFEDSYEFDFGHGDYTLRYAMIDGKVYGDTTLLSIQNKEHIVHKFRLIQNYPNPFNTSTTIEYEISQAAFVKCNVFDIRGNLIKTLMNLHQEPGRYSINWDASGNSSGVYIIQIIAGDIGQSRKCILLK